jgi:sec-independent protein translocase protein TatA
METVPQNLMYFGNPFQLMLVLLVVVLLFGTGKVSSLMGDVAKGIKEFKKGLADDEPSATVQPPAPPKPVEHDAARSESKSSTETGTKA